MYVCAHKYHKYHIAIATAIYALVIQGSAMLYRPINRLCYFCAESYHLVQTAHDNSLVSSYGGQGSDPHLPSTK